MTGEVRITQENLVPVLEAAVFLKMDKLEKACMDHVIKEKWLCIESVCFYYDLSTTLNTLPLKDHTFKYVERNFVQVSETPNFNEMQVQCVEDFVSSSGLQIDHEIEVFDAITRWIEHSRAEREKFIFRLLKHVRLPLMTAKIQEDLVKGHSLCKSNKECLEWINYFIKERAQKEKEGKI